MKRNFIVNKTTVQSPLSLSYSSGTDAIDNLFPVSCQSSSVGTTQRMIACKLCNSRYHCCLNAPAVAIFMVQFKRSNLFHAFDSHSLGMMMTDKSYCSRSGKNWQCCPRLSSTLKIALLMSSHNSTCGSRAKSDESVQIMTCGFDSPLALATQPCVKSKCPRHTCISFKITQTVPCFNSFILTSLTMSSSSPVPQELTTKEQTAIRTLQSILESVRRSRVVLVPQMSDQHRAPNDLAHNNNDLFDSRFGGSYAWPNDNGSLAPPPNNFFCLLQLNLSDLNVSTPNFVTCLSLPQSGLLQFFIRADDNYGMDATTFRGNGFQIVHHDLNRTAQWVRRRPLVSSADKLPLGSRAEELLARGIRLSSFVQQANLPPSRNDHRLESTARSVYWDDEQHCGASHSPAFDQWYEDHIIPLDHETSDATAWLGGHARWSQGDIRTQYPNDNYQALLSLASDGEIFQWGDMGDATFLVRRNDVKDRNFANALYSWDCF